MNRSALLLLAAAVAFPAAAAAQELVYSASVQLSSGSYIFTEPTRTLSLYNGLTWTAGRVRLGASVPLLLQNSGAVNLVGGAYLPTGGTANGAVGGRQGGQQVPMGPGGPRHAIVATPDADPLRQVADSVVEEPGPYELSIGDPLVSGGIEVYRGDRLLRSLELTGSVKPPINDLESGVGTGEWDYAVGAAAALGLGAAMAFVDVTRWWYGDLPELELRDGLSWAGGLGLPVSRAVWVSAMATGTNRIIESAEAARTASVGLSYRTAAAGTLFLTAGAGLSETAADFTLSLGWRRSLTPRR